jgi:hypothetical protein
VGVNWKVRVKGVMRWRGVRLEGRIDRGFIGLELLYLLEKVEEDSDKYGEIRLSEPTRM